MKQLTKARQEAVSDLSRTGKARSSYLAWEGIKKVLREFANQERLRLKKHQSVRDIHKARKDYMTSLLKGTNQ